MHEHNTRTTGENVEGEVKAGDERALECDVPARTLCAAASYYSCDGRRHAALLGDSAALITITVHCSPSLFTVY